jgi:hypothetical protein
VPSCAPFQHFLSGNIPAGGIDLSFAPARQAARSH